MRKFYRGAAVFALLMIFGTGLPPSQPDQGLAQSPTPPNIIFVLTDDQDTGSLEYMPKVQAQLVAKGTTFENGILTLPVCCPSRATMLRGQYAHNHSIGDGSGGENGARAFRRRGLENSTVATWLDKVGYRTALVGKYLNEYDYRYVPAGWDRWYANVGDDVWAECLNENGKKSATGANTPTPSWPTKPKNSFAQVGAARNRSSSGCRSTLRTTPPRTCNKTATRSLTSPFPGRRASTKLTSRTSLSG